MKLAVFLTLLIKLIARNESVREFIEVWSVVSLAFAPKYSTDFSELLELRAKLNDSTPGTSEHDEALHELQNHMEDFITRIDNDYNLVDLKPNQVERLKEIFGGSAYRKLVEKRNGELDEPIRRNSAEEQATELTEQAAIEFMEQGELSPQELQELQQMLGDTLEQLEQAADLTEEQLAELGQLVEQGELSFPEFQQMLGDPPPRDGSSGQLMEGHEVSIAAELTPDPGTTPGPPSLGIGTPDIDGDLPDFDPPLV